MRVGVYPADEGGCGYYRMIWPAMAVQQQYSLTMDVNIHLPSDIGKANIPAMVYKDDAGKEQIHDVSDLDYDAVVLQRPLGRLLADMIPYLQRKGVAVIVELDDDFDSVDPSNVAWTQAQPQHSPDRNRTHLRRACEQADMVVVTTDALARRYGAHGRVRVIPNFAREKYLTQEKQRISDQLTVGWSGSILTHPRDLQVTRGGVWSVMKKHGARLAVVGTGKGVASRLGIPDSEEVVSTGWVDIEDLYPASMAAIDVGVVPLEMSAFNQAKSWLKGLEFSALGVPFVASPTEPYQQLHQRYGLGLLASDRNSSWAKSLDRLCRSVDAAAEAGAKARAVVDGHDLVIERQARQWFWAWREAILNGRDARLAARNVVV